MAGASPRHSLIAANIVAQLVVQLRKRSCTVHSSDLRVKSKATGLYTYPDVVVVCGKPQYEDQELDTLLQPKPDRGGVVAFHRSL